MLVIENKKIDLCIKAIFFTAKILDFLKILIENTKFSLFLEFFINKMGNQ